ncbi:UvrD-helicase domain-containing protein [bacterium]|nr:UvrD-helicase domain-containing protein [bacterium]
MVSLTNLNPQQRKAVTTIDGPVLVLSGAGTGKTRTVTFRIAYMLEKGIPAKHILAVTFTNKAAREMRDRVRKLVGDAAGEMQISTFHSFGARLVREYAAKLGLGTDFTIYDSGDQLSIVRKALRSVSVTWKKYKPDEVLQTMLKSRAPLEDTLALRDGDGVDAAVYQRVWDVYRTALRQNNAVDFDDLLFLPLRLFRRHADALNACRDRYRYILVDEYQDTNSIQFQILHALAGTHRNICVVGDDDQSIYGWRGAEIRNILDFEKHFRHATTITLEENYRSTSTILKAANAVIAKNEERKAKALWTRHHAGEPIRCLAAPDEMNEAEIVVTDIITHRRDHHGPYSAYAILMRMNALSRPFEEVLRRYKIPYVVVGGMQFYDRKEVRDFLSYLRLLVNPHDDEALLRIINVPPRNIGPTTVEKLGRHAGELKTDLYEALARADACGEIAPGAREAVKSFHAVIEEFRGKLGTTPPSRIARELFERIEYRRELEAAVKNKEDIDSRLANVESLIESIAYYERQAAKPSLAEYVSNISLMSNDEDEEMQKDKLPVMTIHAAKGLEFPFVYLVGAEQKVIPHERSVAENGYAEERRLMYVAITRAQRQFTVSHCRSRMRFGTLEQRQPSEFLKDIPEDLIVHLDNICSEPASEDRVSSYMKELREMYTEE